MIGSSGRGATGKSFAFEVDLQNLNVNSEFVIDLR